MLHSLPFAAAITTTLCIIFASPGLRSSEQIPLFFCVNNGKWHGIFLRKHCRSTKASVLVSSRLGSTKGAYRPRTRNICVSRCSSDDVRVLLLLLLLFKGLLQLQYSWLVKSIPVDTQWSYKTFFFIRYCSKISPDIHHQL